MRAAICLCFSAAFAGACMSAHAQTAWPARPIRLLVPFAPGGVGDITSRAVAAKLSESFGQQVIIDNRPSAGGAVASEIVARAEPDGHTLLLLNNLHAISAGLFKSLPYDAQKDFVPVSTMTTFGIVILAAPDSSLRSLKDLIAQAKAAPGKLNVGTVVIGSTQHLSAELFKSMAGLDMTTVPFNSTAALVSALRGNNVQVAFEVVAPIIGQIKAGALRPLAVTLPARFSGLPDVPTVAEAGVPGYQVTGWNGIGAPAKTPRAVVDRLNQAINAALAAPDIRARFPELGVEARGSTPEEFRTFLAAEIAKWKAVIATAKIERQ